MPIAPETTRKCLQERMDVMEAQIYFLHLPHITVSSVDAVTFLESMNFSLPELTDGGLKKYPTQVWVLHTDSLNFKGLHAYRFHPLF